VLIKKILKDSEENQLKLSNLAITKNYAICKTKGKKFGQNRG
jgi:hypothetical protein